MEIIKKIGKLFLTDMSNVIEGNYTFLEGDQSFPLKYIILIKYYYYYYYYLILLL